MTKFSLLPYALRVKTDLRKKSQLKMNYIQKKYFFTDVDLWTRDPYSLFNNKNG